MNKARYVIRITLLSLCLWQAVALLQFSGFDNPVYAQRGPSAAAVKVIITDVVNQNNDQTYNVIGTAHAIRSIDIYPQVSGVVKEVLFSPDSYVEKGTVLLKLDEAEQDLAVQLAQVRLNDAQNLLSRYERVINNGGVTQNELTAAKNAVKTAQIELSQAKLALEKRQIKAPFSGFVGIADVDVGDRVDMNTRITGLDDRQSLYVEFDVPEALISALSDENASKIELTTQAYPNKNFIAHIIAKENRVNAQLRTRTVRAKIDNPDNILLPGMSFQINWRISGESLPAVPQIALQWGRQGAYLWQVKNNVAHQIPVEVIARKGEMVMVRGELNADDAVVIEGLQRLRPDTRVEILGNQSETLE